MNNTEQKQAGEAAHTPTPWAISRRESLDDRLHPFACIQSAGNGKLIAEVCERGPKGEANANHILYCVNYHRNFVSRERDLLRQNAALVEALENTLEWTRGG